MKLQTESYFGKYREIIIAVAMFVVLDLSILAFNFFTSFQIDQDTVAINLAGRQRYTSQRIARTLLEMDAALAAGRPYDPATLTELRNGASIFHRSAMAFREGGILPGGDGKPVQLNAVTTARGRQLEADVESIWAPYHASLQPLLQRDDFTPDDLAAALAYSQANNLKLLAMTNDFVTETQAIGASRASNLRAIQTAGILLALLNFGFILFKFIRRLRENDRVVEAAQRETTEILDTVKEGLFLLDADFRIGSQYSSSLSTILDRPVRPGDDFKALLRDLVAPSVFMSACDYIELLLGDRVKESLVKTLNPLTAVEISVASLNGEMPQSRFLTFQFNRASQRGRLSHLLVTVTDVTAQVELERTLAAAKNKSRGEFESLTELLNVDPATLGQFLKNAEATMLSINDQLRAVGGNRDYRSTIAGIFRSVHAIKGEAAQLGLAMFEELAQEFERLLAELRDKGGVSGDDLLALPLPLDDFLQRIALVQNMTARLAAYHDAFRSGDVENTLPANLAGLAQRIARDYGKEVQLETDLRLMDGLPEKVQRELKDIAVQLVRNAVAHGIEPTAKRAQLAKQPIGKIQVMLKTVGGGEYEFVLRDDGRGIAPSRIRQALVQSGRYSEAQIRELDDRQVLMKIFEPGFSTAERVTKDAGHGVGMDVVKQKIQQLGARLRIVSEENLFTQFSIRFSS